MYIEYNRVTYKKGSDYILLIKEGQMWDYSHSTNLRNRRWNLIAYGSSLILNDMVKKRLQLILENSLYRAKNWNSYKKFDLAEYKELYHSKIKNARKMENIFDDFKITFQLIHENELEIEWLNNTLFTTDWKKERQYGLYDEVNVYSTEISNWEQLQTALMEYEKANYKTKFLFHNKRSRI